MNVQSTKVPRRNEDAIAVSLRGRDLLEQPLLNKGTAFSDLERHELGLLGFLPPHVETLDEQSERCYEAFCGEPTDLDKHVYLRNLQDENETLFYHLALAHISEMLPILYTPVVGAACQRFSQIYRRPRGLFISFPERDHIDEILQNCHLDDVQVIVVTDAERILGLGDQGAGGMGIPIGKLSLYTAIGGVDPAGTLPILLDVGTNNRERLSDPLYIGWRNDRISGPEYDQFIEAFVSAVERRFPNVLLQWEDFASKNATPILARYRDRLCTFNDDIQGTAAVATGTLLAAVSVSGSKLDEQRVVMLGAGSAGIGISAQLIAAMVQDGASEADARARIYMLDSHGLVHDGRDDLADYKKPFAQPRKRLADWQCDASERITLADTVRNARPTVLVGVTGRPNEFTEAIVREMAQHVERPIIFPLSNPTSHCEALPSDLVRWTDGQALIATGSPFEPVAYNGRTVPIAQCNNSYIFPAMGLGVLASGARRVTDEMFMAAALALRDCSPALKNAEASLLPRLDELRDVARHIAAAVAATAQRQGLAPKTSAQEMEQRVDEVVWQPAYRLMTAD